MLHGLFVLGRGQRPVDEPDDGLPSHYYTPSPEVDFHLFVNVLLSAAETASVAMWALPMPPALQSWLLSLPQKLQESTFYQAKLTGKRLLEPIRSLLAGQKASEG